MWAYILKSTFLDLQPSSLDIKGSGRGLCQRWCLQCQSACAYLMTQFITCSMRLQRNAALFSHPIHRNYKQLFEFFQRHQNQPKDTSSSYFTIFLKVWDQQTSLCLFLHVGTHPLACGFFLLLPCVAGQNFPTLAFLRWVSKSFSSSVTLSPHQPLPGVLCVCGAYMSGFDQEAEYGLVPGLPFRLTKTWCKAIILQTSHSPGVSRHAEITSVQRTLWPVELISSLLHPDHHFSVHF